MLAPTQAAQQRSVRGYRYRVMPRPRMGTKPFQVTVETKDRAMNSLVTILMILLIVIAVVALMRSSLGGGRTVVPPARPVSTHRVVEREVQRPPAATDRVVEREVIERDVPGPTAL